MKREDIIILILGLLLLAGMLFTIFFGGEKSMHGVGDLFDCLPGNSGKLTQKNQIVYFLQAIKNNSVTPV